MNFDNLVRYIKRQGCRVRILKKKTTLDGAMGTFHVAAKGPIIFLATKGVSLKKSTEYLLHEYGHFLQWKCGFMQAIDGICNSYEIFEKWIEHEIELTPMEIEVARNAMLLIEWDAELRAIQEGISLEVEGFDPNYHLRGALVYMMTIKWTWANRKRRKHTPKRKKIKGVALTTEKLFSPLTKAEKRILGG